MGVWVGVAEGSEVVAVTFVAATSVGRRPFCSILLLAYWL